MALTAAFAVSSCSKDDDPAQPVPPVAQQQDPTTDPAAMELTMQLLTANEWKLTGLTQGIPGQTIFNDIYNNSLPACQRDDVYSFHNAGKTVGIAPGVATCTPGEKIKNGTWSLKNSKSLTVNVAGVTQAGLTGEFEIVLLENNRMTLKQTTSGSEYLAVYEKFTMPTKLQLLTANPWKVTAQKVEITQNGTTTTVDNYANLDACNRDNFMIFQPGGTGITDEGPTKCNPGAPQTTPFSWAFNGAETHLELTENGSTSSYEIVMLSANMLTIKTTISDSGIFAIITTSFTAQR